MSNITKETLGFTIVVEHESGGKVGTWVPNLKQAFIHIKRTWNTGDNYIRIFPTKYKDRMRLK